MNGIIYLVGLVVVDPGHPVLLRPALSRRTMTMATDSDVLVAGGPAPAGVQEHHSYVDWAGDHRRHRARFGDLAACC